MRARRAKKVRKTGGAKSSSGDSHVRDGGETRQPEKKGVVIFFPCNDHDEWPIHPGSDWSTGQSAWRSLFDLDESF